jgi:hypothetical protein
VGEGDKFFERPGDAEMGIYRFLEHGIEVCNGATRVSFKIGLRLAPPRGDKDWASVLDQVLTVVLGDWERSKQGAPGQQVRASRPAFGPPAPPGTPNHAPPATCTALHVRPPAVPAHARAAPAAAALASTCSCRSCCRFCCLQALGGGGEPMQQP